MTLIHAGSAKLYFFCKTKIPVPPLQVSEEESAWFEMSVMVGFACAKASWVAREQIALARTNIYWNVRM